MPEALGTMGTREAGRSWDRQEGLGEAGGSWEWQEGAGSGRSWEKEEVGEAVAGIAPWLSHCGDSDPGPRQWETGWGLKWSGTPAATTGTSEVTKPLPGGRGRPCVIKAKKEEVWKSPEGIQGSWLRR